MNSQKIRLERAQQVNNFLAGLRTLQHKHPDDSPEFSAAVSQHLQELAARVHLWQPADFPINAGHLWGVYQLHEETDGSLALYASAALAGHAQPPHNHTTWACIAGVMGLERNRYYRALDGGLHPGPAQLALDAVQDLQAGDVCFLGPKDIHDIEIMSAGSAMHLHLYGRGLPHLTHRLRYDLANQHCEYFPAFTGISIFDLTP